MSQTDGQPLTFGRTEMVNTSEMKLKEHVPKTEYFDYEEIRSRSGLIEPIALSQTEAQPQTFGSIEMVSTSEIKPKEHVPKTEYFDYEEIQSRSGLIEPIALSQIEGQPQIFGSIQLSSLMEFCQEPRVKLFSCEICDEKFTRKRILQIHKNRHHTGQEEQIVPEHFEAGPCQQ